MEKYVITLSRQFGSMGRTVARRLSEELGIEYLDRDIVEETALAMGLPSSTIDIAEEGAKKGFLMRSYPLGIGTPNIKDQIFVTQEKIILEACAKEPVIIVGRCGDYILKNHPRMLSVYVYAPYDKRLENCTSILGMDENTARRMIREVDAARENYYRTYIPGYESPFDNRDLCINTAKFGVEGTVEIIKKIVEERFN